MPSMGLGHSACSTKGGCRGSFDLVLLVTLLGRSIMFVRPAKPNGRLHIIRIFVKAT
jgi:hypothetical protein